MEDTISKLEKERDSNLATIIELKRKVSDLNNELKVKHVIFWRERGKIGNLMIKRLQ